ncbi:MAG TPA: four helix bundle protein [Chthoniobacterales bacterium]|jgi:four helix bundle protein
MTFRFEKLEVWQRAREFNRAAYDAVRHFPKSEEYALSAQLRRAAISVSSNIAEGSGRNSDADFAHFLEIAYGSLMEVVSQIYLAFDQSYMNESELNALLQKADVIAGQLSALARSLGREPRRTK